MGIVCVWPKGSVAVCLGQTPQLVPPKVGQNQTRLLVTRDSRSHETILKLQPPKKRRGPLFALRTLFSPRPTRLSAPSRLGLWSARAPPRRGSRLRRRGSALPPSCRRAPGSGPPPDAWRSGAQDQRAGVVPMRGKPSQIWASEIQGTPKRFIAQGHSLALASKR